MFERFTGDARAVVAGAVERASRAGSPVVTEEHLLLSLLDREDTAGARVLAALGVTGRRAEIAEGLAAARRRGGMSRADEEALADLGISVAEIVARVEGVHGPGALSRAEPGRAWPSGRPAFTKGAKKVLEKALRVVVARKEKSIGDEHLLLGLLAVRGVEGEVLERYGASYEAVEAAL